MSGYTRQGSIINGETSDANMWNSEYDTLAIAFDSADGHRHDGTAAEGGLVPLISNPEQTTKAEVVGSNIAVTGGLTVTGTLNGRDLSADSSKLDGIEAGATADQTAGEIKSLYESNANTNNFSDSEKTKLAGIESGATGDQTASEILTLLKTVDGSGSGLDADLLNGLTSSSFMNVDGDYATNARLGKYIFIRDFDDADSTTGFKTYLRDGVWYINPDSTNTNGASIVLNGGTVWHSGNDGASSGLDADLLDGFHASQFLRSDVPEQIFHPHSYVNPTSGSAVLEWEDDFLRYRFGGSSVPQGIRLDNYDEPFVTLNRYGPSDFPKGLSVSGNEVYHAGNLPAAGTDAQTLDGLDSTQFLRSDTADTKTGGALTFQAGTNGSTDYTAIFTNSAGSLSTGIGAYGMSNKLASSQTSDFVFETGGKLVLKPGNSRFQLQGTGPTIELMDTDSTGNATAGLVRFLDSGSSLKGYLGLGSSSNQDMILYSQDGGVSLYADGTKKLEVTSSEVNVSTFLTCYGISKINGYIPHLLLNEIDTGISSRMILDGGQLSLEAPTDSILNIRGYNNSTLSGAAIQGNLSLLDLAEVTGLSPQVKLTESDTGVSGRLIVSGGRLFVQGPTDSWLELTGAANTDLLGARIKIGGTNYNLWHEGTFDPSTKAEASHNHDSVYIRKDGASNGVLVDNSSNRQFILNDIALLSSNISAASGTIVVRLGKGGYSTMYNGEVVISRNYSREPVIVNFCGYSQNNGSWSNTSASTNQPQYVTGVRFGKTPDGDPCLFISNDATPTDSTWSSYVNIRVKSLDVAWIGSQYAVNQDPSNYSTSFVTDETGYTSGNLISPDVMWTNYNDGSGSGLDADLLDGKHASDFIEQLDGFSVSAALDNTYGTNVIPGLNADLLDGFQADDIAKIATDFVNLKQGNGYQKLPNGLVIQWGGSSISGAGTNITFPIAFDTVCLNAVVTPGTPTTRAYVNLLSDTYVNVAADQSTYVYWIAIGI